MCIEDNDTSIVYDSVTDASICMGVLYPTYNKKTIRSNITRSCRHNSKTCERKWKYVDEPFVFREEEWKQLGLTPYYFSKHHEFYYNKNKKSIVYGSKSGTVKLPITGSMLFIEALWVCFNGEIPRNMYVGYKDINNQSKLYDNIDCFEYVCLQCESKFESDDNRSRYCSKQCKNKHGANMNKEKMRFILRPYIAEKIRKLNSDLNADVVIENVPGIKTLTCTYCNLDKLTLCSGDGCEPCKLSIDAMHPERGHVIDNLVGCCWMCNRMKNTMPYQEWITLLSFLKGETKILDWSNKKYVKNLDYVSKTYKFSPWSTLNAENQLMFIERNSAKEYFRRVYTTQNGKDALFNLFPLISFMEDDKTNVSCDKINCNDNTAWQLLPLFINYAKSTLTNEQLVHEFQKRNFLLNIPELSVILPDTYYEDSAFIDRMNGKRTGKGHFGMKRSDETRKRISEAKKKM